MAPGEIATIMRALGRLEARIEQLGSDLGDFKQGQDELRGELDALAQTAAVTIAIARARSRAWGKLVAVLVAFATLTSAGTGAVAYWSSTTHASTHTTRIVRVP